MISIFQCLSPRGILAWFHHVSAIFIWMANVWRRMAVLILDLPSPIQIVWNCPCHVWLSVTRFVDSVVCHKILRRQKDSNPLNSSGFRKAKGLWHIVFRWSLGSWHGRRRTWDTGCRPPLRVCKTWNMVIPLSKTLNVSLTSTPQHRINIIRARRMFEQKCARFGPCKPGRPWNPTVRRAGTTRNLLGSRDCRSRNSKWWRRYWPEGCKWLIGNTLTNPDLEREGWSWCCYLLLVTVYDCSFVRRPRRKPTTILQWTSKRSGGCARSLRETTHVCGTGSRCCSKQKQNWTNVQNEKSPSASSQTSILLKGALQSKSSWWSFNYQPKSQKSSSFWNSARRSPQRVTRANWKSQVSLIWHPTCALTYTHARTHSSTHLTRRRSFFFFWSHLVGTQPTVRIKTTKKRKRKKRRPLHRTCHSHSHSQNLSNPDSGRNCFPQVLWKTPSAPRKNSFRKEAKWRDKIYLSKGKKNVKLVTFMCNFPPVNDIKWPRVCQKSSTLSMIRNCSGRARRN